MPMQESPDRNHDNQVPTLTKTEQLRAMLASPDPFVRLAEKGTSIRVIYVPGQWLDVDDAADITKAGKFL